MAEEVLAFVGPEGHLALRMVDAVEGPPAAEGVFAAVSPVVEEIEEKEVGEEGEPRSVLEGGDEVFEVGGDDVMEAEGGVERIDGGLEDDKKENGQDAEAGEEGIYNVDAGGGVVIPPFDGEEGFERAQERPKDDDFHGAEQEEFGPFVRELRPSHEVAAEEQGLEKLGVEPRMQLGENFYHQHLNPV